MRKLTFLTLTVILYSLKSGKVSFKTDAKGRKQIDVSELTRVYGQLNAIEVLLGSCPAACFALPTNEQKNEAPEKKTKLFSLNRI